MSKNLPMRLREVQQGKREQTYHKIEAAVKELKEENRPITRAIITERSGLAPSTFSKQHVKNFLLKRFGVGAQETLGSGLPTGVAVDAEKCDELLRQHDDLMKRFARTEQRLDEERDKKKKAMIKITSLEHEVKVLRGELDIAKRKIRVLTGKDTNNKQKKNVKLLGSDKPDDLGAAPSS